MPFLERSDVPLHMALHRFHLENLLSTTSQLIGPDGRQITTAYTTYNCFSERIFKIGSKYQLLPLVIVLPVHIVVSKTREFDFPNPGAACLVSRFYESLRLKIIHHTYLTLPFLQRCHILYMHHTLPECLTDLILTRFAA